MVKAKAKPSGPVEHPQVALDAGAIASDPRGLFPGWSGVELITDSELSRRTRRHTVLAILYKDVALVEVLADVARYVPMDQQALLRDMVATLERSGTHHAIMRRPYFLVGESPETSDSMIADLRERLYAKAQESDGWEKRAKEAIAKVALLQKGSE